MRAAALYREGIREQEIAAAMLRSVAADVDVQASLGEARLVEVTVTSPLPREALFRVVIEDPEAVGPSPQYPSELRLLTSAQEWGFLRTRLPLAAPDPGAAAGGQAKRPQPRSFGAGWTFAAGAGESVTLPLLFQSFRSGRVGAQPTPPAQSSVAGKASEAPGGANYWQGPLSGRRICVRVEECSSGGLVAELGVNVKPQPFVVHRTVRYFAPGPGGSMTASLPLPPSSVIAAATGGDGSGSERSPGLAALAAMHAAAPDEGAGQYVHCPRPDVAATVRDGPTGRTLHLRCRVPDYPTVAACPVLLFDDPHCGSLRAVWEVVIHPVLRHDVHAVCGTVSPLELVVRGGEAAQRVRLFTSHPDQVRIPDTSPFQLTPKAYNRLVLALRPTSPGPLRPHVHLVDVETKAVVAAWRLEAAVAAPVVTQEVSVFATVGEAVVKRLPLSNDTAQPRSLRVTSADPAVLKVLTPLVELGPDKNGHARVQVAALPAVGAVETLIFVEDKDDPSCPQVAACIRVAIECYNH